MTGQKHKIAKVTIQRVNVNTFSLFLDDPLVKTKNTYTEKNRFIKQAHQTEQTKIVIKYMDKGQLNQNQKKTTLEEKT